MVDGRHRRADRAAHRGDDELRLARAEHLAARVPARRAPRVRPRARHDPRAPEPGRAGKIPWDKPKVYAYYAQQGWSKADVDFNIFEVYDEDETNFTDLRPDVDHAVRHPGRADDRLVRDRLEHRVLARPTVDFMRRAVPELARHVELDVGGARFAADLAVGSEVDTFHFDVADPATHIVTTDWARPTGADPARPQRARRRADLGRRPRPRHQRAHRPQAVAGGVLAVRAPQGPGGEGTYDIMASRSGRADAARRRGGLARLPAAVASRRGLVSGLAGSRPPTYAVLQ